LADEARLQGRTHASTLALFISLIHRQPLGIAWAAVRQLHITLLALHMPAFFSLLSFQRPLTSWLPSR
jgi:hypothetical protein